MEEGAPKLVNIVDFLGSNQAKVRSEGTLHGLQIFSQYIKSDSSGNQAAKDPVQVQVALSCYVETA